MSTYLAYLQFTLSNTFENIMTFCINVCYPLMELHLIFSKVYGGLIVTKQVNARIIFTKVKIQTFQLKRLFARFINSHIFCFSLRLGNNRL
jgi:hypothetical protein